LNADKSIQRLELFHALVDDYGRSLSELFHAGLRATSRRMKRRRRRLEAIALEWKEHAELLVHGVSS
jgi:hypothetical protein